VIAMALNGKGGSGRMDAESETPVAHALRADGFDASEDGTGRGVPLVTHTLDAASAGHCTEDGTGRGLIAFNARQDPIHGDIGLPLDTDGTTQAIAFDTTQITSKANYSNPKPEDACHPLASTAHPPAIAFTERTRADGRNLETQDELAYALTNPNGGGGAYSRKLMTGAMAVRRLTVRECERLQGFPDDYTLIPYRGKAAADGPRYKALGNSFAVPVIRWIGERIQACRARNLHAPNYKIAG
jgi:DNA (cytosine-5)-methyltransferase 1